MSSGLALPPPVTLTAPTGVASLPLVELDRAAVLSPRKQIRLRKNSRKRAAADCSFGDFNSNELEVDAWPLFHAAKKTELAMTFTASQLDRQALCFAAEFSDLFIWDAGNLRRVNRSVFTLEDFAEAGLAGRFGEAIACLTMQSWGYIYFDRIAVLWERAAAHSGMSHSDQVRQAQIVASALGKPRPDLEPDFAFEKASGAVALMESKGSFVHPINDNPTTKDDLRHALNQLAAWTGMITPTPAKSYAIGTYFRDQSDMTGDPSLVTYVDPPGQSDDQTRSVEFRPDWIRRGNYGAWLVGMGFTDSGNALRTADELRMPIRRVPVVSIRGRDFAFAVERVLMNPSNLRYGRFSATWLMELFILDSLSGAPSQFLRDMGIDGFQILGIDCSVLRRVEQSLLNPASMSLVEIQPGFSDETAEADLGSKREITGSLFPDGTWYGMITPELFIDARRESFHI